MYSELEGDSGSLPGLALWPLSHERIFFSRDSGPQAALRSGSLTRLSTYLLKSELMLAGSEGEPSPLFRDDAIPSERATNYRVGPITMLSHRPMGVMRDLQFPSAPKYCLVAKAQPLTLGSTDTEEKSPNLPCELTPPEGL